MKKTNIVNKSTSFIHIQSSRQLTLVERKLSNILLKKAQDSRDFIDERLYSIPVPELMGAIGWESSKNTSDLKRALEGLVETRISFNVFQKEQKKINYTGAILAEAEIQNGVCRYSYPTILKSYIVHLNLYARIDLEISKLFKSKNAHTLWEFLVECLSSNDTQDTVSTPWITIDDFLSKILNKKKGNITFKRVNHELIKKSINEINQLSNIRVVDTEFEKKKDGVYVRFQIKWANPDSPVDDTDRNRYNDLIMRYANIKATKSAHAYANVVKNSLKKGETTIESIQAFMDRYDQKKGIIDQSVSANNDSKKDRLYEKKYQSLTPLQLSKFRDRAIEELERSGIRTIRRKSICNDALIKGRIIDFLSEVDTIE